MTENPSTESPWAGDFPGLRGVALELARQVPDAAGKSFSEHWAETFAAAIEADGKALPISTPESLVDAFPIRPRGSYFFTAEDDLSEDLQNAFDPEPGVIYAALSTRQGGGNRECYCEDYDSHEEGCLALNNETLQDNPAHILDFDDSFDSTYATFVFRTNFTAEDVEIFAAQTARARLVREQHERISRINAGELTPWSILSSKRHWVLTTNLRTAENQLASARRKANPDALKLAETIIDLSAQIFEGNSVEIPEELQKLDSRALMAALGFANYSSSQVIEHLREASQANAVLSRFKGLEAEASALPDGSELRSYLLADRGQGSYNTTEKRGRRNVTVAKTYSLGSVLGKEVESAERSAARELSRLETSVGPIELLRTELQTHASSISELSELVATLKADVWAAGWHGSTEKLRQITA